MQLALTVAALIGVTVFGSTCNNPVETMMARRAAAADAMLALDSIDRDFEEFDLFGSHPPARVRIEHEV